MLESAPILPPWRQRLRACLLGATSPERLGVAAGLGAALGVAPLPGLQMAVGALLAWWLRLNVAVVLAVSNLSFGPLLALWWGLAIALGGWLRRGESPIAVYDAMQARFAEAEGFRGVLAASVAVLGDWLLGCAVLMVILALVVGGTVWLAARLIRRSRGLAVGGPP